MCREATQNQHHHDHDLDDHDAHPDHDGNHGCAMLIDIHCDGANVNFNPSNGSSTIGASVVISQPGLRRFVVCSRNELSVRQVHQVRRWWEVRRRW